LALLLPRNPGGTAVEATRSIRKEEDVRGIAPVPIMGLTANTFESDKQRCLQAGMDDVKCKPISRDALLERISLVHRASLLACGGTRRRSARAGKGLSDGGAERGAAGGGAAAGAAGAPGHRNVAQLDQAMRTVELNLLSGAR
jgi:DNA-binding response OmpR family regulator